MTAFELLKSIKWPPMSKEHPCTYPSHSELKRWLKKKSVLINGVTPDVNDEVKLPIDELVFFHKSPHRIVTIYPAEYTEYTREERSKLFD